MRSLFEHLLSYLSINPAAHTATANGAAVDGAEAQSKTFQISVGAWTDGTHTLTFEARETTSDSWVAIPAAQLRAKAGVLTGASVVISDATKDGLSFLVEYMGGKRYVRVVRTLAGTTTGAVYAAGVLLSNLRSIGMSPMSETFES